MANPTPNSVRAVLLAFKGCERTHDIKELADVMKDQLGWKVTTFWIDDATSEKAQEGLNNILYALDSTIRPNGEKLVLNYCGRTVVQPGPSRFLWETDVANGNESGALVPSYREDYQRAHRTIRVDPIKLFLMAFGFPIDVLFLFHSYLDCGAFRTWAQSIIQENPDVQRSIQALVIQDPQFAPAPRTGMQGMWMRNDSPCQPLYRSEALVHASREAQRDGTRALSRALREWSWNGFSVVQLFQRRPYDPAFWMVTSLSLLGRPGEFFLPRCPLHTMPPPTLYPKKYDKVHVLLLSWKSKVVEDRKCIDFMYEAFGDYLGFDVRSYRIPGLWYRDHNRLVNNVVDAFLKRCDGEDTLLIVYYVGHSDIEDFKLVGVRWVNALPFPIPDRLKRTLKY